MKILEFFETDYLQYYLIKIQYLI